MQTSFFGCPPSSQRQFFIFLPGLIRLTLHTLFCLFYPPCSRDLIQCGAGGLRDHPFCVSKDPAAPLFYVAYYKIVLLFPFLLRREIIFWKLFSEVFPHRFPPAFLSPPPLPQNAEFLVNRDFHLTQPCETSFQTTFFAIQSRRDDKYGGHPEICSLIVGKALKSNFLRRNFPLPALVRTCLS